MMKRILTICTFFLSSFLCTKAEDLFFSTLTVREGLPANIISAVAQDRHGFIWIGTGSGLARYDGYHFKVFKKSESEKSLSSNEINSVISHGDYIWIGTWNGLCKMNIRTFEITRLNIGSPTAIRTLHIGGKDILWVGTGQGLVRFNMATEEYRIYDHANSELSHNMVRTIHEDSRGNLWVGTYDGLNFLNSGQLIFKNVFLPISANEKPDNHLILDIKRTSENGTIWVGTETGLYKIRTDSREAIQIETQGQLSNEVIKCIYNDPSGQLWLGTDFGLNILQPIFGSVNSHFHNPDVQYSIANNVIWQIFEDSGGVLWFATSNGLSRSNKQGNFYQFHDISFEINKQVIGNQVKSFLVSSKGIFWMATQNGVVRINPKNMSRTIFA